MLTKSDFLTYLDSPMHLWAKSHGLLADQTPSVYEQFLAEQGQQIEYLAQLYLKQVILSENSHLHLHWQSAYDDGRFQIRADALIWDEKHSSFDLYEVKSATSAHKAHIFDLAFQVLLLETLIPLRHAYLVHIDNTYQHGQQLDLGRFFVVENLTEQVESYRDQVEHSRQDAWKITQMPAPKPEFACTKPHACPCPDLCHPELPENPIYHLPFLGKKAVSLREMGIMAIEDIPPDFSLSDKQRKHVEAVRTKAPLIDRQDIRSSLATLQYPLYFLDYETFNPAVPIFPGYQPYEHIVFQYSLFVLDQPGADPRHFEALFADGSDPAPRITPLLVEHIREEGSVIVWNKSFEAGRNQDLARHCPQYKDQLLGINTRLYDLMLIFRDGHFIDPRFQGSASLKAVLPVLCPELQYTDLAIQSGEAAMLTWYKLHIGAIPPEEQAETIESMKVYCKLDTFGMLAIWKHLRTICEEDE